MIRSWGVVTLTGSAQPWFGDVTTAVVALQAGDGSVLVTVGSTTRYRDGDRIVLDPGASDADTLIVQLIKSATVLLCYSESGVATHTHVNSTIIQLAIPCMDISIQAVDGNAATVWLGSDSTVTVAGGSSFFQLQKVAAAVGPNSFREANSCSSANVCRTTDGWMIGTANDKVAMAAIVL